MKLNNSVVALLALAVLGGCATVKQTSQAHAPSVAMEHANIAVQLKWNNQAQFAGFYAAQEKGFFKDAALDVTFIPGGPGIVPEQAVAVGLAQFGVDWAPHIQVRRAKGSPMVEIAQLFQRSGAVIVLRKSAGLNKIEDLKGKKFGIWLAGNEYEFFPALLKHGINPKTDVEIVNQADNVTPFVKGELDAVAAMSYNELYQIYNSTNTATGKNYSKDDLTVIPLEKEGLGIPEDAIFTSESQLSTQRGQDVAERFLRATFRGFLYCRTNPQECVDFTLKYAPGANRDAQSWMMNEVNRLIWPSKDGIGMLQDGVFNQMNSDLFKNAFLSQPADGNGFTMKYKTNAIDQLHGLDMEGTHLPK